jgi:hypothetical protein
VTKIFIVCGILASFILTSCASSTYRARQEKREKLASSAGLYCEWISGDKHADIDVEVNLQMAQRCDSSKPFSLTTYKNNSDQNGIMYCCATANSSPAPSARKASGPAAKSAAKAEGGGAGPAVTPAGSGEEIEEDGK